MAQSPQTSSRVAVLDGLRGLAVALVVIYHFHEYISMLWPGQTAFGETEWIARAMGFFWIGVDLFYVLSGFFIGSAVLRPQEWQPVAFIKNRLARILPAYYVSMFVVLLLLERSMLDNVQGLVNIAMHLLRMHNLQEWSMFAINGPYWTLGVEFTFYVAMLGLAPLFRSRSGWIILPLMLAVCYTWRAGLMAGIPAPERFFFGAQLPGALDEFAAGMAVALIYQRGWLSRFEQRPLMAGVLLAFTGCLLVLVCMTHFVSMQTDYWQSWGTVIFSRTLLCVSFAIIISAFLVLARNRTLILVMHYSQLQWLGKVSFSVYLYHVPIILLLHRQAGNLLAPGWLWNVVAMVLISLVSFASYRWVEKPWHANL